EPGLDPSATGAAHEQQSPPWADPARGVSRDLHRHEQVRLDVAPRPVEVELRDRRVVGTGARSEHMVDLAWELLEEGLEPVEVRRVERVDPRGQLFGHAPQ